MNTVGWEEKAQGSTWKFQKIKQTKELLIKVHEWRILGKSTKTLHGDEDCRWVAILGSFVVLVNQMCAESVMFKSVIALWCKFWETQFSVNGVDSFVTEEDCAAMSYGNFCWEIVGKCAICKWLLTGNFREIRSLSLFL